jgi:hypothetical protein
MALLTDQILASGVTLNDLFHIVITGDTSQNPAGSSYKATVQQLAQAIGSIGFSGGTVIYPTYFTNGLSANTFFATTYLNLPRLPYLPLSGGTVSGSTNFTGGLSANTFSATTYLNLPRLPYLPLSGGTVTGSTIFTSGLTANTFSATTYLNLPRLLYLPLSGGTVTGGTIFTSGLTANTINISSTPTTDTSLSTNYLTRDSSTGNIKVKQIPGPTVYGLFAQTGDSTVISATTVETSLINGGLGTLSVAANGFSVGDSFRADIAGVMRSKNNETITVRVKANSVVLLDSGAQTLPLTTNDIWYMSINFTIRQIGSAGVASIVSLGTFHYTKTSNGNVEGFSFNTVNNTTFDTTIPNTLDILVSWSSTDTGNSIYSDIFVLNKIF